MVPNGGLASPLWTICDDEHLGAIPSRWFTPSEEQRLSAGGGGQFQTPHDPYISRQGRFQTAQDPHISKHLRQSRVASLQLVGDSGVAEHSGGRPPHQSLLAEIRHVAQWLQAAGSGLPAMKAFIHSPPSDRSLSFCGSQFRSCSWADTSSAPTEQSLHGGVRKKLYFASCTQHSIGSWCRVGLGVSIHSHPTQAGAPLTSLDYLR